MRSNIPNIKVLLCLNGRNDPYKFLHDRQLTLLRYALEAAGIDYTFDPRGDYDVVHLLTRDQLKAYRGAEKNVKNVPIVLSLFNTPLKNRGNPSDPLRPFLKTVESKTAFGKKDVASFVVSLEKYRQILNALNVQNTELVSIGAKDYEKENYGEQELGAFRSYYRLNPEQKFFISYGEDSKKRAEDYIRLALSVPDADFFYFGENDPSYCSSMMLKLYEKKIYNLHFAGPMPEELYHSALFSAEGMILLDPFHTEVSMVIEAMKANLPVFSVRNEFLKEIFVEGKNVLVYPSALELSKGVLDYGQSTKGLCPKETVSELSCESYGDQLVDVYQKLISESYSAKN